MENVWVCLVFGVLSNMTGMGQISQPLETVSVTISEFGRHFYDIHQLMDIGGWFLIVIKNQTDCLAWGRSGTGNFIMFAEPQDDADVRRMVFDDCLVLL